MNKKVSAGKKIVERFNKNSAEIGALLAGNNLYRSYTTLRLARDLKEIQNQKIPIEGVTAYPINEDLLNWHANIKNIADNPYKGIILHIEIRFTGNYPKSPPTISVKNPGLKHKSITAEGKICLEMLNPIDEKKPYSGWSYAYSVLSVLIQLQNFFFDVDFGNLNEEQTKEAQETVAKANEYKCSCCPHDGSSNPYPEFLKTTDKNEDRTSLFLMTMHLLNSFKDATLQMLSLNPGISCMAKIGSSNDSTGTSRNTGRCTFPSLLYSRNHSSHITALPSSALFLLLHVCTRAIAALVTGSL